MPDPEPGDPADGSRPGASPADPRPASRRVAWILSIVVLAAGILLWRIFGEPILESYRWEREPTTRAVHGIVCPGYYETPRGAEPGLLFEPARLRVWHPESGYLVMEAETDSEGVVRTTYWTVQGKVMHQSVVALDLFAQSEMVEAPPWRWGIEDQDSPSLPADLRALELPTSSR